MFNRFSQLQYLDPKRELQFAILNSGISALRLAPSSKTPLRPEHKRELEHRQGAFFAYARTRADGAKSRKFGMVPIQDDPVDSVLRYELPDGSFGYEPVQLKELVPEEVNRHQSIREIIEKIRIIVACNEGLSIAVHMNREEVTDLKDFLGLELRGNKLWLFGLSDTNVGFLAFDLSRNPQIVEFGMPRLPSSLTEFR